MTPWLLNCWYVAGFEPELEQPFVARRLLGRSVVMFRNAAGELGALEDRCSHRFLPLSMGKRVDDTMQCGYHGMRFDATGRCVEVPGQKQVPERAHVRAYPLIARDGFLWIWMGDAALADPALVPDMHWNASPDWTPSRGYHHFAADFRLLNDNLLDLSHESYVHVRTIGNEEEESIANYPLEVSVDQDRRVRAHREMNDIDPPPFFAMVLQTRNRINRWQTALHLLPSLNMTDSGVYPVGTSSEAAFINRVMHLLTPETETSTHYFWSVARNYRLEDTALTDAVRAAIAATFDEDKVVIEEQQRQVQAGASIPGVAIRLDEAAIRARRLLDQARQREEKSPRECPTPLAFL